MKHEISYDHGGVIYNVTTRVEWPVAEAWLKWMKEEHTVRVIATGCFTKALILRLLETDETDGPTFAVQYFADNRDSYNRYINEFAESLRKESIDKWGEKVISFRSVLEIVD